MPISQATPLTLEQRKQFALIVTDANRALASLADPIRLYGQKMQDSLQTIRPQIEFLSSELKKAAKKFNAIKPVLSSSLFLPPQRHWQSSNLIPLGDNQGTELIDETSERVERKYKDKTPKFKEYFENLQIGITAEGRFYHKNRPLKHISTNSKHGRFFKLLLESSDNYVEDSVAEENLQPADKEKGLSYIRDDLIKAVRKDSLYVELYRNKKEGYKLIKITKIKISLKIN